MTISEKDLERLIPENSSHLVTGPPGSGKTYTLIQFVKYLINSRNIDPSEILVFSFNRRWSKILREQTAEAIDRSLWEIPIETFYSFCIEVLEWTELQKYQKNLKNSKVPDKAEYYRNPGIEVLNSVEQWDILTRTVKSLPKKDYPYTSTYINSNEHVAGSFLQEIFDFILRAQENLLDPDALLKRFIPGKFPLLAELSGVYSRYTRDLEGMGKYNYGMLLMKAARLLDKEKAAGRHFREKYKYIIVDEFQESNAAQFIIVNSIIDNNCIFFGNDDQAIYSFRGAVADNFRKLYRKLKKQDKVFFLEKNYRSSKDIIKITDGFVSVNKGRIKKKNVSSRRKIDGEIGVKSFSTVLEEAGYICQKIQQLKMNHGIRLENMAVLVKGLGYETHLIEDTLAGSGIPFVRRGTRSLLDNKYVSYIISFLKLVSHIRDLENPDKRNVSSPELENTGSLMEIVLLSDAVGLDPLFFSKLKSSFKEEYRKEELDFWTYIKGYTGQENGSKRREEKLFKEKLSWIMERIAHYSKKIDTGILDFLMDFLDDPDVGLFKFFDEKKPGAEDGRHISISTGDYLRSVMEFMKGTSSPDIKTYLGFIDNIESNQFLEEVEESTEEQVQPGMVNILSFHQCKGMEYDAVFIPFINNGYLPSKFRNQQVFDIQVFRSLSEGTSLTPAQTKKEHMAGEVRLFYNGLTRAKRFLYVTSCRSKAGSVFFEKIKSCRDSIAEKKQDPAAGKTETFQRFDRSWKIRKKSMVALYRMERRLKTDLGSVSSTLRQLNEKYPPGEWWDGHNTTKNKNRPLELFKRPFSYSSLETYRDCPFKYKIRYFFGVSVEESMNMAIGISYHQIMQRFFDEADGDYTWERLKKLIKKVFEGQDLGFPSMRQEIILKAESDFKRYLENYFPSKPEQSITEKKFRFKLDAFTLEGRIDQVNIDAAGKIEVVDFKSGSSRYSDRELEDEIQLKLYRLAVEKDRDLKDLSAGAVRMKYIILGAEKGGEIFLPDQYFDAEEISGLIKNIVSRISSEDFRADPKSYMSCNLCDYEIVCPRFYGKND